jgi:uncharacterized protein (TIGR03663 family)
MNNLEDLNLEEKLASKDNNVSFAIGAGIVTFAAIFLRFFLLELKPLHHDEGVNGHFLLKLFKDGVYQYDPSNYHGPTLYYISLAFTKIFGMETFSIRASVAVFGVFIVILALYLRRYIGTIGSLSAALFLALSPGMVYISRYFIHEISFVFFSLAIVVGVLYFIEKREAGIVATAACAFLLLICFFPLPFTLANSIGGNLYVRLGFFLIEGILVFLLMRFLLNWDNGRPVYLVLASASCVLFFATKETAFITLGTMLIAIVCVWVWRKIYFSFMGKIDKSSEVDNRLTWSNFLAGFGSGSDSILLLAIVLVVFAYIGALFFSSFFTYPKGLSGAFEAYAFWTKTGTGDHTQSGYLGYAKWMLKIEAPIIILSVIGTLFALLKGNNRFALFSGFWAFGLTAAYSIIPYKTPWLALSFILPMCIIAGYGIDSLSKKGLFGQISGAILAVAAVAVLGYQTTDLNFYSYDDDTKPYVYAHTERGFLELIDEIERYAVKSGQAKDATIEIVSPDYWSMPWYMRNYPNANFHGSIKTVTTAEMIVGEEKQIEELITEYSTHYKWACNFPLRPGVVLVFLVRKDLADESTKEIYQIDEIATVEIKASDFEK